MVEKHLVLGFLWLLFCVLHSLLAALGLKKKMAVLWGKRFKHYRLFYSLFAFATLGFVVYYQFTLESPYVYQSSQLSAIAGVLVGSAGLVIMGICIKKYFLSLSGLKSLFQENPTNALMISGIHRFVRHPLYAGTFMAIWGFFIAVPLFSLLIANVIITGYTLIGIELEEKKLEAEFGHHYRQYKQNVPKLFPSFRTRLNKRF